MKNLETLEMFRDGEDGNSISSSPKQCSQLKSWFFTWNNYRKEHIETLRTYLPQICDWAIVEEEIAPTTGTKHLQGVIGLKKRMRWSEFDLPKQGCHPSWSKTRNIKKAQEYCSKDGTVCIKFGIKEKYKIEIPDFYYWQKKILKILESKPDERTIYWFWEEAGCSGKTTFQKYIYTHFEKCVVLGGKSADMKNGVVDYLKNNEFLPEIILINIPKTQEIDYVSYTGMEEVKDMFFYSGKYEGGMVCGANPHMFVFANEPPKEGKLSADRWVVEYILKNTEIEKSGKNIKDYFS